MALEMKYFVLKPRSKGYGDRFAKASRAAMVKFADEINDIDPDLAWALKLWVEREEWGELNRFYTLKYPWHPTESDMRSPSTTGHAQELEPKGGNMYRPHKMLIDSGRFWRCAHGNTGYADGPRWVGCEECKKDDPEAYAKWLGKEKKS